MKRLVKESSLQRALEKIRKGDGKIGFTPTLGALHEGHLQLMRRSKSENDISVCSIFVNPTQFNEASDLEKYPRDLKGDIEKLKSIEMDLLFNPSVKEVYPTDVDTAVNIDFMGLDKVMEGAKRPGHFEGVVQVVKRLLDLVKPDRLYMGQKDFQQFTIIDHMIKTLNMKVELVVCPIVREKSGLAMSSRNERLSSKMRKKAAIIYTILNDVVDNMNRMSPEEAENFALINLTKPGFRPEYFSIVDGHSLQKINNWNDSDYIVACTAVWVEEVRLIDNVILKTVNSR